MATYPALDVRCTLTDGLLSLIHDCAASAVEERADLVRVFFSTARGRTDAQSALGRAGYRVEPVDVDDEDWAKRSQEGLEPVTVGRITIFPCADFPYPLPHSQSPSRLSIVIQPSTGFGTGHHATTRLCLRGLQEVDLTNLLVLDIGTGSGVLAIAAIRLGAVRAVGIDRDADAIAAARENLRLNPGTEHVELLVADMATARLPTAHLVTANLTGASLVGAAATLRNMVCPGGTLIVSGLLDDERDHVVRAFEDARAPSKPQLVWEQHEHGWTALMFVL